MRQSSCSVRCEFYCFLQCAIAVRLARQRVLIDFSGAKLSNETSCSFKILHKYKFYGRATIGKCRPLHNSFLAVIFNQFAAGVSFISNRFMAERQCNYFVDTTKITINFARFDTQNQLNCAFIHNQFIRISCPMTMHGDFVIEILRNEICIVAITTLFKLCNSHVGTL